MATTASMSRVQEDRDLPVAVTSTRLACRLLGESRAKPELLAQSLTVVHSWDITEPPGPAGRGLRLVVDHSGGVPGAFELASKSAATPDRQGTRVRTQSA
jgi:hypothetical protein